MTNSKKLITISMLLLGGLSYKISAQESCDSAECFSFVVGKPNMSRTHKAGQTAEKDNFFTVIQLPNNKYRGFTANQQTYRMDSPSIYNFNVQRESNPVLKRDISGLGDDECGSWLMSVLPSQGMLYGITHVEKDCRYTAPSSCDATAGACTGTHFGTSMYGSTNNGETWSRLGTLTDNSDETDNTSNLSLNASTRGEGNCSAFTDSNDSYSYTYCTRARADGWRTIALRASSTNLDPSSWKKWSGTDWSLDNDSDNAAALINPDNVGEKFFGSSAGYLSTFQTALLLNPNNFNANGIQNKGIQISVSSDKINFSKVLDPLVPYLEQRLASRPNINEGFGYPSALNMQDGTRSFPDRFLLSYVYIGNNLLEKNQIARNVYVTKHNSPVSGPQVKLVLSRWSDKNSNNKWTTTSVPITSDQQPDKYRHDANIGLVLTREYPDTVELKQCKRTISGVDYFLVAHKDSSRCNSDGYIEMDRRLGWIYTSAKPGTVELYSCKTTVNGRFSQFLSKDINCENKGTREWSLGYVY